MLGVRKVFDLRADFEIIKYKTATPVINGVEVVRASIVVETMGQLEVTDRYVRFFSKLSVQLIHSPRMHLQTSGVCRERGRGESKRCLRTIEM